MNVDQTSLRDALSRGDPQEVLALIAAGADIHYKREEVYNALIDGIHGRDISRDSRLLNLLELLIDQGVGLSAVTSYSESGLRVLSRVGRFDGVRALLEAGADKSQLEWTPLMEAVALGTITDVENQLARKPSLEDRDWWSRTAWLISLLTGDITKATLLRDHGADVHACGRCGQPPLFYAIQGHHLEMLRWLLEQGADVHKTDEHGYTALMQAVEADDEECVNILLQAGANVGTDSGGGTALNRARSRAVALHLIEAGADPAHAEHRVTQFGFGAARWSTRPAMKSRTTQTMRFSSSDL